MTTSHAGDIPGRFLLCPSSPSMCCLRQLAHRHPGPAEPFVWATAEERDHLVCALPVGVTTAASAQVLGLGKWVGGTWCGGREQAGPFQAFMFGLGCSFIIQKKNSGEHLLSACLALCLAPDGGQTMVLEVLPQRAWPRIQNLS